MKSIFKIDQTTKGFLCLLSVFAAGLSSCDDDNLSDGNVTDGSIEFRFDLPQTRAVIAEQTGEGFFEDNDKVGLYAYESGNHRYHQLTLQGGHWLPSLKPAELGKMRLCFLFFIRLRKRPPNRGRTLSPTRCIPIKVPRKAYSNQICAVRGMK